jgi:hypothetical protein
MMEKTAHEEQNQGRFPVARYTSGAVLGVAPGDEGVRHLHGRYHFRFRCIRCVAGSR